MTHVQRKAIDHVLSLVNIDVNRPNAWVTISETNGLGKSIFLQGDDASAFISYATAFYNKDGNVTMKEAYALQTMPYLDLLGEE